MADEEMEEAVAQDSTVQMMNMDNEALNSEDYEMSEDIVEELADLDTEEEILYQPAMRQLSSPSAAPMEKDHKPNQSSYQSEDLPFLEPIHTWSGSRSDNRNHSFDFSFASLSSDASSLTSMTSHTLLRKSMKRDCDGKVKGMITEFSIQADLAMSRESSAGPRLRGRRLERGLPSPRHTHWPWDQTVSPYIPESEPTTRPQKRRTSRNRHPLGRNPKDADTHEEEAKHADSRKRKGSLLEWRNKERFEEPVRI